jgi:hypothetical protein
VRGRSWILSRPSSFEVDANISSLRLSLAQTPSFDSLLAATLIHLVSSAVCQQAQKQEDLAPFHYLFRRRLFQSTLSYDRSIASQMRQN